MNVTTAYQFNQEELEIAVESFTENIKEFGGYEFYLLGQTLVSALNNKLEGNFINLRLNYVGHELSLPFKELRETIQDYLNIYSTETKLKISPSKAEFKVNGVPFVIEISKEKQSYLDILSYEGTLVNLFFNIPNKRNE